MKLPRRLPSALSPSLLCRSLLSCSLLLAAVLSACAVDAPPDDASNAPAGEPALATTSDELGTLACEPYDPAYCDEATSCEVSSQYVQCNSGVYMFAHWTPDCRWCIPRDVCGWNPPVCPF